MRGEGWAPDIAQWIRQGWRGVSDKEPVPEFKSLSLSLAVNQVAEAGKEPVPQARSLSLSRSPRLLEPVPID